MRNILTALLTAMCIIACSSPTSIPSNVARMSVQTGTLTNYDSSNVSWVIPVVIPDSSNVTVAVRANDSSYYYNENEFWSYKSNQMLLTDPGQTRAGWQYKITVITN